ncbi:MAG: dihydroorotate dehydrogenase [Planctomycetes bacterium]|nr:dihydroorotate dehydrogenase [Planctomycetota bacterium]
MHDASSPLEVAVGDLRLRSPLLTASGTFNLKTDLTGVLDVRGLGGIVTKTVTRKPRPGNPPPRIAEVPGGLLNSIGLENEGLEGFRARELPRFAAAGVPLIVSIGGDDAGEFAELAAAFGGRPEVAAVEINVSCPNVDRGTAAFAARPAAMARVVQACRDATRARLWVKLSPESPDLWAFARAAEEAGASALTVANSHVGLAVDWRRRRPVLGRGAAGYTGPGIKPLTLRLVQTVAGATRLPVVGAGGVESADDVMDYLVAGASAVEVGTAYLRHPGVFADITAGLERFVQEEGIGRLQDWVGTLAS